MVQFFGPPGIFNTSIAYVRNCSMKLTIRPVCKSSQLSGKRIPTRSSAPKSAHVSRQFVAVTPKSQRHRAVSHHMTWQHSANEIIRQTEGTDELFDVKLTRRCGYVPFRSVPFGLDCFLYSYIIGIHNMSDSDCASSTVPHRAQASASSSK